MSDGKDMVAMDGISSCVAVASVDTQRFSPIKDNKILTTLNISTPLYYAASFVRTGLNEAEYISCSRSEDHLFH